MKHVEDMNRAELIDELGWRLSATQSHHLALWSTPSLKAMLVFTRERTDDERDHEAVHPQLGITLALRMSLDGIDEISESKN